MYFAWMFIGLIAMTTFAVAGNDFWARANADVVGFDAMTHSMFCEVTVPSRVYDNDGNNRLSNWSPCDGSWDTTSTASVALKALSFCETIGFAGAKAWEECASLVWRNHWHAFEEVQPFRILAAFRPSVDLSSYHGDSPGKHGRLRNRRALSVRECELHR
jgi:hypothetical protein